MCRGGVLRWLHSGYRIARRTLRSRKAWAIGLAFIFLFTVDAVNYERYVASSDRSPETYPVLALDEYRRLLVLAPHCDDEVLGAGGLIQAALRQGMEVRVVIATAGDGYRRATIAEFHRVFLTPEDFIAMGERRQQESLDALARLGLEARAITFLTYPERGLAALWWDFWESEHPYRSPYSKREQNLYPRTFHPSAPYSGEMLLDDLHTILAAERPDLIVMPHPNDEHPDHRALGAFTILAVAMEQAEDPAFQPRLLGYLVHYGLYPQPFGLKPQASLCPPRLLEPIGTWQQWQLSPGELAAKREAVDAYRSQQRVLGPFLHGFVRQNELYMDVDAVTVFSVVEGETFLDADSVPALPNDVALPECDDPVSDSVVRRLRGGADIANLYVLRLGDSLWVALNLRAPVSRTYGYYLHARAIAPQGSTTWSGHYGRKSTDGVTAHDHTVWYRLDIDALGDPDWLALAAETRQGIVLDHTAWYLIYLQGDLLNGLANPSHLEYNRVSTETCND